jgi:CRP/FNR family transcriptional regulator, cyclic AMP receptor protein
LADLDASTTPTPLLDTLDDGQRDQLLNSGRDVTLPAGSSLLFEGDVSGRVVAIVSGAARVFATAANGREVLLNVVGPGEVLGTVSALDGGPHSASVTTIAEAEVVFLDAAAFRELLDRHAWLAEAVAAALARDLRRVERHRVELSAYDVPTRLAGRLVYLADHVADRAPPVTLPVSQRELGEWCGASREAVTKALKSFRARGWVETHQGSITIVDLDAIRGRAP